MSATLAEGGSKIYQSCPRLWLRLLLLFSPIPLDRVLVYQLALIISLADLADDSLSSIPSAHQALQHQGS